MSKNNLNLDHQTLLMVLQVALDSAIDHKEKAMGHHDQVARGFHVPDNVDAGTAMAIKEVSESLEKYLKSADASLDKIIKIARILADTMLRAEQEDAFMSDEEKERMQAEIHQMINTADENKDEE